MKTLFFCSLWLCYNKKQQTIPKEMTVWMRPSTGLLQDHAAWDRGSFRRRLAPRPFGGPQAQSPGFQQIYLVRLHPYTDRDIDVDIQEEVDPPQGSMIYTAGALGSRMRVSTFWIGPGVREAAAEVQLPLGLNDPQKSLLSMFLGLTKTWYMETTLWFISSLR